MLLPMMALFCAFFDIAMVLYLQNTFQDAVNQAVRWAITYQTTDPFGAACPTQNECIVRVVERNSMGWITPANRDRIWVRYYRPSDLDTPFYGNSTTAMNAPGNVVQVSVRNYPWRYTIGLWLGNSSFNLSADATSVMQNLPVGVLTPPASGPAPGGP